MNETLMIIIGSIFNFASVTYLLKKLMPIFKNFIDIPNSRKVHQTPIVRIGGLSIFATFCLFYLWK